MIDKRDQLPLCFWCEHDGRDTPCRDKDGIFLPERLAEALLQWCRHEVNTPQHRENSWAFDCMETFVADAPHQALQIILSALPRFQEDAEIAVFAAGPVENLIVKHGPEIIDSVENEAAANERFRYLLSGIWGRSGIDPRVWRRLQIALKQGPWLDNDPRTPQGSHRKSRVK